MQYRTKSLTVEAIRFSGDNFAEVEAFILQSIDGPVEWDENPRRPIVLTPRGRVLCSVGEWVLRTAEGSLYVCSPKLIDAFFEEAR